jgi:signal transduction histidine kinase
MLLDVATATEHVTRVPWAIGLQRSVGRPLRATLSWLPRGLSLPVEEWATRHRWLVTLLWLHAAALPVYGVWRGYEIGHALLEGGAIAAFAIAATADVLSVRWRAALGAVGLVTASAVLVHFSAGLIEAHFHFFVVILLLTLYEDWIPFLIALGYVVVHHGVAGGISPELVYNHPDAIASPWKWALVHGGFVAAAAAGAVVAWRLNEAARARAGEAVAQAVRSDEANAMKSKFIATTSHELRTPLTSIGGFATTLLHRWDDLGDEDKQQMVQIIEGQSGRLRHLIEDLLVLSTIESGNVRVRQSSVDVAAVAGRAVRELGLDGRVEVELPPGLAVHADARHVEQILVNLLANARKYGAAPISVAATAGGGWVELAVADGGAGVPSEFVPHLFETFTRADGVEGEGTGLGLSVVRGLAEANGGSVRYEPRRPQGACFRVRLPAVPQ